MPLSLLYDVVRGLYTVCPEKVAMSLTSCASPGVWPRRARHIFLCFDYVLKVFFLKKDQSLRTCYFKLQSKY